jgi:D-sedoheptulose 7-phosphate isomerase
MQNFAEIYIKNLTKTLKKSNLDIIKKIINKLDNTKGKIYIIGNGGSAATASHMVNDLGAGLRRRNVRYFDVESLNDNTPVCSALANDIGYDNIFYMQLKGRLKAKDTLIAISCSGNSKNIIKAVKYANKKEATVIGITGFDGGKLKKKSDINYHVPTKKGEYGIVEDAHMILNHIIYSYYLNRFESI